MNLEHSLLQILPRAQVKTSLLDRVSYAGDAGFYQLIPRAVVIPRTEAEIQELFDLCRSRKLPLVFRAAGTSLSGQAITDGILVDVGKFWLKSHILDEGRFIRVQPGIIGARVNMMLATYGTKIGPDPASINAAMMGGILSNNASGMCCGVAYNSYHTLQSIRFMLPSGHVYDTAVQDHYPLFEERDKALFEKLLDWKREIMSDNELYETIRRKYRLKNTVGYGLNAFVDYEHPLDILAHLMIGAEGTLGFISEAVLQTLPDLPYKSAAMLYFPGIYEACQSIPYLKDAGAEALELMDRSALKSVEHLPGLPAFFSSLPQGAAALLCEFQAADIEGLQGLLKKADRICADLGLLYPAEFTTREKDRQFYWKIRKGMFPSVGAVRQRGTTVLLEDVAFPVEKLADALVDLQRLFTDFGYNHAIIFGHAKEGNIHFVITQLLNCDEEVKRYDAFMQALVKLVLEKYGGSLKAEHGTGRNMAPFVEAEWGGVAYRIMRDLKNTVDPFNILNPGVIINEDKQAHIRNLKQMPEVEHEVDKCIECGFCEHHCPSKNVTLTPRQRIQVRRHLKHMEQTDLKADYHELLKQYQYGGLDTCATDGLCQVDCPVEINTGDLVKRLRHEQHGPFANKVAGLLSRNFSVAEWFIKALLQIGCGMNALLGSNFMTRFTGYIQKLIPVMPMWWKELQRPPEGIYHHPSDPQYVYVSACIQRMMGNDHDKGSIQEAMLDVCQRAGISLFLPKEINGHCCGQAFSSKGYFDAARIRQRALVDALWKWTEEGRLPVVCDFTSCTYTLLKSAASLEEPYRKKLAGMTISDSIKFLNSVVIPSLAVPRKKTKVVLHPGCAATKMNLIADMKSVGESCSSEVIIPAEAGCCGMAGDRGFLFPELTKAATQYELDEVVQTDADGYYGSAKTCEMALTHFSGKQYRHLVYLVKDVGEG